MLVIALLLLAIIFPEYAASFLIAALVVVVLNLALGFIVGRIAAKNEH